MQELVLFRAVEYFAVQTHQCVDSSPVNGQWALEPFPVGGRAVRKGLLPGTHVPGAVVGRTLRPLGWMPGEDVLGSGASLTLLGCTWVDLQPRQQCVPWLFPFFPFVAAWLSLLRRLLSRCGARASCCGGFSACGARA